MSAVTLRKVRRDFDRSVQESLKWIKEVNELATSRGERIDRKHVFFSYEYGFLRIFVSWEKFIQDAFIGYMTGKSIVGHKHKSFLRKTNEDHALELLTGTKTYPDWSKFDDIYKLADLFFVDPESFKQPLREIERQFIDIKKIRNAIVHISAVSITKFEGLLRANMPRARIDMGPGEFLSTVRTGTETFSDYYVSYLETTASKIVPI